MIFHSKLKKWLPPGGHIELGELPHEAALREAYEETGLEVELLDFERVQLAEQPNARCIPSPYFMLEEKIPTWGDTPEHRHIDCIYIAKPKEESPILQTDEEHELRWLSLEEILEMKADKEIFIDTQLICKQLFEKFTPQLLPMEA